MGTKTKKTLKEAREETLRREARKTNMRHHARIERVVRVGVGSCALASAGIARFAIRTMIRDSRLAAWHGTWAFLYSPPQSAIRSQRLSVPFGVRNKEELPSTSTYIARGFLFSMAAVWIN